MKLSDLQRLSESLSTDSALPWKQVPPKHGISIQCSAYEFMSNKTLYSVEISETEDDMHAVTFSVRNGVVNITGDGNAFKVFATVGSILKDYSKHNPQSGFEFTAYEPSRIRLYNRLVKMIAQQLHMKFDVEDDPDEGVVYYLTRH